MEIDFLEIMNDASDFISSNEDSGDDEFQFKEKRQRLLPVNSNNSLAVEGSAKNTCVLLIHRVICVYFMQFLKRKGQFKPSVFLLNNQHIEIKSLNKYDKSKYVLEILNDLKQKQGYRFLELDQRVKWLTNNTLISLSEIPEEVLESYTSDPNRLRGLKRRSTQPELSQKSPRKPKKETSPRKPNKVPINIKQKHQKNEQTMPDIAYLNVSEHGNSSDSEIFHQNGYDDGTFVNVNDDQQNQCHDGTVDFHDHNQKECDDVTIDVVDDKRNDNPEVKYLISLISQIFSNLYNFSNFSILSLI